MTWKSAFKRNFIFGLIHIAAGVPLILCLSALSVLGLLFCREYFHGFRVEMQYVIEERRIMVEQGQGQSQQQNEGEVNYNEQENSGDLEQNIELNNKHTVESNDEQNSKQENTQEINDNEEQNDLIDGSRLESNYIFRPIIEHQVPVSFWRKSVYYVCFDFIASGMGCNNPIWTPDMDGPHATLPRLKAAGIAQSAAFHLTHNFILITAVVILLLLGYM